VFTGSHQTRLGNYIKNIHAKVWDRNIKNNSRFNQNELDLYHQNFIKLDEKYSSYLRRVYYDYGVYNNQAHFYFVTIILYDKKLKQINILIYYSDENYQNLIPIPQALLNIRQGKYLTKESFDPEWVIPHKEKSLIRIPILLYKILIFYYFLNYNPYFKYQDNVFYIVLITFYIIPVILEMIRINLEDNKYIKKHVKN